MLGPVSITVGIILLAFTSLPNMIYYIVACIGFIFIGLGLDFCYTRYLQLYLMFQLKKQVLHQELSK